MKRFVKTRLFSLLEGHSQVNDLLKKAYEEFSETIFAASQSMDDLDGFYSSLAYAQIELVNLQGQISNESGEK